MAMRLWINARGAKLLEEINKVPHSDTSEDEKLDLICSAMREVSVELFKRAANKSRKDIADAKNDELNRKKQAVEDKIKQQEEAAGFNSDLIKPTEKASDSKIKLKSSLIRIQKKD
jgi:hypothetical protein